MTRGETLKAILADLARPFALYSVSGATAVAIVRLAWKGDDLSGAAVFITAALGGLVGLYVGKAWENASVGKSQANIEVERAKAAGPPAVLATGDRPAIINNPSAEERSLEDPA